MTPSLPPDHLLSRISTRLILHVLAPAVALTQNPRRESEGPSGRDKHQPIFILGPPRCGSTILYQAMTNYYDVVYIDNLAARWARVLPFGIRRSVRRFGRTPHNTFSAQHGDTKATGGWHGPSECGNLWYRWISQDQHYVGWEMVTEKMVTELRDEVAAVQSRWNAPLFIKNLHVGQRLAWVSRSFPEARYVCIHRNHEEVVKSILAARQQLGIPPHELWSTRPRVYEDLQSMPEVRMVEEQVKRITAEIEESLSRLPRRNVYHVRYEVFSGPFVEALGQSLGLDRRDGGTLPSW